MNLSTNAPILRSAALQRAFNAPLRRAPTSGIGGAAGRTAFASVLARVGQTGLARGLQPHASTQPPFNILSRQAQPAWPGVLQQASISPQGSSTPGEGRAGLPFGDLITAAATRHGVDPALLAAVAKQESAFNPRAQSRVGAKGLMQLMDATARGLGVEDPFDPAQSLEGGARFLGGLLRQFDGDVRLALAAYNAGPGAVQRYGGVPPYQETQRYVPKVLALADEFRRIWADPVAAIAASGQTS